MTTYVINKKFNTRVERTERVLQIAEAFGLGLSEQEFVIFDNFEIEVKQGDIVYITGQSGSGKSLLLKELESQMSESMKVVNLDKIELDNTKSVIEQIGSNLKEGLEFLSNAGINDAYLYIRKPSELSDGQRYRFRLAKAIESGAKVWVIDEFMAVLDRTAAKVIAYSLQKVARKMGATVIVATTHTDMVKDLHPDLFINKRYREKLEVKSKEELDEETDPDDELSEIVMAVCAAGSHVDRGQVEDILLRQI